MPAAQKNKGGSGNAAPVVEEPLCGEALTVSIDADCMPDYSIQGRVDGFDSCFWHDCHRLLRVHACLVQNFIGHPVANTCVESDREPTHTQLLKSKAMPDRPAEKR